VFKTTPTLTTFREDCKRAKIDWRADYAGKSLDRHALRTTFVTWLSVSGVEPRTAQQLARHTDISLTMQAYTDPRLLGCRQRWKSYLRSPRGR
jgi:site-specific recombinase XerD